MPYELFKQDGKYCTRNIRNGKITHYTSAKNRETGIKMREMYSHGFVPVKQHTKVSQKGKPFRVKQHARKT